jgi:hypothetical protein
LFCQGPRVLALSYVINRKETPQMAAITTKARVQLRLVATTALSPSDTLSVVRQAVGDTKKGGGLNALNFSVLNMSAQVNIVRELPNRLALSITSLDRRVELCTFSVRVTEPDTNGKTHVQIGGLETYKTTQQRALIFIPIAPASIWGYPLYKHFLDVVAAVLSQRDPSTRVSIATPSAT